MPRTRSVRLSTGFRVPLDGDLLAVVEALYQEVTVGTGLAPSFETMRSEIASIIDQMSPADRKVYLAESLFLNSVTYENEMLSAYVRKLGAAKKAATGRPRSRSKATEKKAR